MNKLFSRGFTLIELMIVVVIMGILAAIGYPAYTRYVVDARRSDAQIALTQLAAQEEKFFSQCNTYRDTTTTYATGSVLACTGFGTSYPTTSPNGFYTLTVAAGASTIATSFTATATPVAGTSQATDGAFRVSNTGLKEWDRNNNGTWGEAGETTWKK